MAIYYLPEYIVSPKKRLTVIYSINIQMLPNSNFSFKITIIKVALGLIESILDDELKLQSCVWEEV